MSPRRMRRYCTRATCDALRECDRTPTGATTFNVMTQDTTEWYVVPDDDPRLDTVALVQASHDPREIADAVGPGLWLIHVGDTGRLCFVQVADDADDRRLPLKDASERLLVPALAALRQEREKS